MQRAKFGVVGLLLVGGVAGWQMTASAQRIVGPLPPGSESFASAKSVEIHDASGQIVLHGDLVTSEETADEVERTANLVAVSGNAKGKAEVELGRVGGTVSNQEIEVEIRRLAASTSFKLVVDGRDIAQFTTSRSGNADLKYTSKMSATK